jgi:hypothetical protein
MLASYRGPELPLFVGVETLELTLRRPEGVVFFGGALMPLSEVCSPFCQREPASRANVGTAQNRLL